MEFKDGQRARRGRCRLETDEGEGNRRNPAMRQVNGRAEPPATITTGDQAQSCQVTATRPGAGAPSWMVVVIGG